MNWGELLNYIVYSVVGLVLSVLGIYITTWINKKIKDDELKRLVASLNDVVQKAVLEVYQTYVENMKKKNIFDEEAQKKALAKCLEIITTNIPTDVFEWLRSNCADIEKYLINLIESQIALLKK